MPRSKISVNTSPVADQYSQRDEKVIEFSSPNGGGLVSFSMMEDGALTVDIYRTDPAVIVRTGDDVRTRLPRKVAGALAMVDETRAELDRANSYGGGADSVTSEHDAYVGALMALADAVRAEIPS
jgi:hypothetical protein